MTDDDDLAARTIPLLRSAVAIIAEAAGDLALAPEDDPSSATSLRQDGDDIAILARAIDVLERRAGSF